MILARRTALFYRYSLLPTLLGGLSSSVWAQSAAATEPPGVSTGMMVQTFIGLLAVIALLFLAAFLLRRFGSGNNFGKGSPLRMVGGLMIGPRERIVVLEIGNEWLVVGIGPGQIRTLHTLPKGELPAAATSDKSFGQWLQQVIERKNEKQ